MLVSHRFSVLASWKAGPPMFKAQVIYCRILDFYYSHRITRCFIGIHPPWAYAGAARRFHVHRAFVPRILYRAKRRNYEWPLRWARFSTQAFFFIVLNSLNENHLDFAYPPQFHALYSPNTYPFHSPFPPPLFTMNSAAYRCSCSRHQCLCRAQSWGCQRWRWRANWRDLLSWEQLFWPFVQIVWELLRRSQFSHMIWRLVAADDSARSSAATGTKQWPTTLYGDPLFFSVTHYLSH